MKYPKGLERVQKTVNTITAGLSATQEQLLVLLVARAQTLEEAHEKTGIFYRELLVAAKELLLMGAIEKKIGYPTMYRISKNYQVVAKKLRAKFDMSDLLDDPCDIFAKGFRSEKNRVSATKGIARSWND